MYISLAGWLPLLIPRRAAGPQLCIGNEMTAQHPAKVLIPHI